MHDRSHCTFDDSTIAWCVAAHSSCRVSSCNENLAPAACELAKNCSAANALDFCFLSFFQHASSDLTIVLAKADICDSFHPVACVHEATTWCAPSGSICCPTNPPGACQAGFACGAKSCVPVCSAGCVHGIHPTLSLQRP